LSSFGTGVLSQKTDAGDIETEDDVHYVTFLMSDGDNVSWLLDGFAFDEKWYGSPYRGEFPMGWTISPMLADLAPTVMERLYEDATNRDSFVAGVSGRGYFYPSELPNLEAEAERTNDALSHAGLSTAYIVDTELGAFSSHVLAHYAVQPAIDGGFWLYYPDNAARGGEIVFSHGKPFVSVTHNLWEGIDTPESIATEINGAPRTPHDPAGYSVVNVHAWSMDLSDVSAVIASLNSDVRVVAPGQLISLVKHNVLPSVDLPVPAFGLGEASAMVLSSDLPPSIKEAARQSKGIYGQRIQIADGVDDHVEIEAAIHALPNGGRVLLSEGRFEGGQIVLRSGISLEGQGPSTVYRLKDGANTDVIFGESSEGYGGFENASVRDLKIDGNRANQTSTSHGIHIVRGLDITISGVHILEIEGSGVLLEDTQRVIVTSNDIRWSNHGITIQDAIYGQNLIEGSVLYGINGNAIQVLAENKVCVDNNFNDNIIREAQNGFFIQGANHTAGGNNYNGNRVLFVGEAAFRIGEWGGGSSITGNYVNDAKWGVWTAPGAGHNLIASNWFTFIGREAMLLQGDHNTVSSNGIDVAGTEAHNTYDAVSVEGRYNLIQGNHVTHSAGGNTYRYGIAESGGADYNELAGNSIQQAAAGPVHIIGPNSHIWSWDSKNTAPTPPPSTGVSWYLWLVLGILGVGVIGAITMSWVALKQRT